MRWAWLIAFALGCQSEAPTPPEPATPKTGAAPEAAPECEDCHPDEVEAWRASPMGRSAGPYAGKLPKAEVVHPVTGATYSFEQGAFSERTPGHTETRRATGFIGSGSHTRSFVWSEGETDYELPLTWYAKPAAWGLSPGYQAPAHPRFRRSIGAECVACHATPVKGALQPIDCGRCHSGAEAHARGRMAGKATPVGQPTRETCEGCHLQGAVRLLLPGRKWTELHHGARPNALRAVFVRQGAGKAVGIASHGERLRLSSCGGAEAGCVGCHRPHTKDHDAQAACRSCHATKKRCSAPKSGADCAGCHMVRIATSDIPHVAMTDHFVRTRPEATPALPKDARLVRLGEVSPKDAAAKVLLGRAYTEAFRAEARPADLQRAARWLREGISEAPSGEAYYDLATVERLLQRLPEARRAIDSALAQDPTPAVRAAAAAIRLKSQDAAGALAAVPEPSTLEEWVQRAHALAALGRFPEARAAAEQATTLRPGSAKAWRGLAVVLSAGADPAALGALRSAAAKDPGDLEAASELAARLAMLGANAEAKAELARARKLGGGGPFLEVVEARLALAAGDRKTALMRVNSAIVLDREVRGSMAVLGLAALAADEKETAMAALDRAVTQQPMDAGAWLGLATLLEGAGQQDIAQRARKQARRLMAPVSP